MDAHPRRRFRKPRRLSPTPLLQRRRKRATTSDGTLQNHPAPSNARKPHHRLPILPRHRRLRQPRRLRNLQLDPPKFHRRLPAPTDYRLRSPRLTSDGRDVLTPIKFKKPLLTKWLSKFSLAMSRKANKPNIKHDYYLIIYLSTNSNFI